MLCVQGSQVRNRSRTQETRFYSIESNESLESSQSIGEVGGGTTGKNLKQSTWCEFLLRVTYVSFLNNDDYRIWLIDWMMMIVDEPEQTTTTRRDETSQVRDPILFMPVAITIDIKIQQRSSTILT